MFRNIDGACDFFASRNLAAAARFGPCPRIRELENQIEVCVRCAVVLGCPSESRCAGEVPATLVLVFHLGVIPTVSHGHHAVSAGTAFNVHVLDLDACLFFCGESSHCLERRINRVAVTTKVSFGLVADVLPGESACVTAVKSLAVAFFRGNLRLGCHACRIGVACPAACREFANNHRLAVVAVLCCHLGRRIHERTHSIVLPVRVVMCLEKVERTVCLAARSDKRCIVPVLLILDVHATCRNEKFRVRRVNCRCDLVRKLLDFGKSHLLGGPAAAFARHAFRLVKDFPSHECLVIANGFHDRNQNVVYKSLRSFVFEKERICRDVKLFVVKTPLVRFHQVVAEKAHRDHYAVFFGDVQSLLHVRNSVFLRTRDQVCFFVNSRALAHVVEKPPADCVTACGSRAFHCLAPSIFVKRRGSYVRVVVAPGEVCTREENLLAVILKVCAAYRETRGCKCGRSEERCYEQSLEVDHWVSLDMFLLKLNKKVKISYFRIAGVLTKPSKMSTLQTSKQLY